jgi:hypothetical protein
LSKEPKQLSERVPIAVGTIQVRIFQSIKHLPVAKDFFQKEKDR